MKSQSGYKCAVFEAPGFKRGLQRGQGKGVDSSHDKCAPAVQMFGRGWVSSDHIFRLNIWRGGI